MAYQVIINGGQHLFGETTRYYIHSRAEILENNATRFFEHLLNIDGELIGGGPDPATDVQAQWRDLFNNVFLKTVPVKIEIKNLDTGNIEQTFDPASFIGTPKMRELVQVPTDGADQATHIKYQASFYIRRPISNGDATKTSDLDRSVETIQVDGVIVKKIWRAKATAQTFAAARALALSFAPTGSNITLDLLEDIDTNTVIATWTWEKTGSDQFTFNCEVTINKTGHPWIERPVVGDKQPPDFHRGRYRSGSVSVRYEVQATDKTKIIRPPPHYVESKTIFRDFSLERGETFPILDPVTGLYKCVFLEFWVFTTQFPPSPNHTTHSLPFPPTAIKSARLG